MRMTSKALISIPLAAAVFYLSMLLFYYLFPRNDVVAVLGGAIVSLTVIVVFWLKKGSKNQPRS